jgi:hypothetical protein
MATATCNSVTRNLGYERPMPCSELISTFIVAYKPSVNGIITKYALAYSPTRGSVVNIPMICLLKAATSRPNKVARRTPMPRQDS